MIKDKGVVAKSNFALIVAGVAVLGVACIYIFFPFSTSEIAASTSLQECRLMFYPKNDKAEYSQDWLMQKLLAGPVHDVRTHLKDFTGLTFAEVDDRLTRKGVHHFESEFNFRNPETNSELTWFYSTSINYLFANAIHHSLGALNSITKAEEPVLDYSGGVGNNVISLALRNISVIYFGIGMMEYAFAEYRIRRCNACTISI